ncbi:MAG: AsmA family protein [Bryobacterales bacterium]
MRKLAKAVLVLLSLYVVVMGGSGLLIRSMLSGGVGEGLRRKAQALLPVEVTIQGGDFDIPEWFYFRPAISFDSLRIANPPGYGDQPMLQADRVAARAKLAELFGGHVAIESIDIERPRLSVETAENGKTNVQALLDALSKAPAEAQEPADSNAATGFRVASFVLRNGEIRYTAPDSSRWSCGI